MDKKSKLFKVYLKLRNPYVNKFVWRPSRLQKIR